MIGGRGFGIRAGLKHSKAARRGSGPLTRGSHVIVASIIPGLVPSLTIREWLSFLPRPT
jgi:hypothetical protein